MNKHGAGESPSSDGAAEEIPAVGEAVVGGQTAEVETPEASERFSSPAPAEGDTGYVTVFDSGTIKAVRAPADAPDADDGAEAVKTAAGPTSAPAADAADGVGTQAGTEAGGEAGKADGSGTAAGAAKTAGKAGIAASAVPPAGADVKAGGPRGPGRPPAPVLAAAAIGGLVLLGVPLALSQAGFLTDGHKKKAAVGALPNGTTADGYRGYVPPTAAPNLGATAPHPGQPAQSPGAPGQGGQAGTAASSQGGTAAKGSPQPANQAGNGGGAAVQARTTFSQMAGPGCSGGSYTRIGYYTQGRSGWLSGSGGGCNGRFDALPMSGGTSGDDPHLYVRWDFDPGSRTRCTVQVYVPNNGDRAYVGGSPAHYSVHEQSGPILAGFSFDQPQNRGQWVTGRSFTTHGAFYVRLSNTGRDWSGNHKTYAHIAAAQVRATCN